MEDLKNKTLDFMKIHRGALHKARDVARLLKIRDRETIRTTFNELEEEGKIFKVRGQRYTVVDEDKFVQGILRTKQNGFGFVTPISSLKFKEDILIKKADMSNAIDGDTVLVRIKRHRGERTSGEIAKVIKRGRSEIVGRFKFIRKKPHLIPRNKDINRVILLQELENNFPEDDEWISAEILDYTTSHLPLIGRLKEIIGKEGEKGIDVFVILKDYGIEPDFPEKVVEQAQAIDKKIELTNLRTDLRQLTTITIDPINAKDFDDAISIEKLKNGNYRLWVHIADVSHYVNEGSELGKEAYKRGNSIYPVDRVVPMLPEELSNAICSLNPNVDRYAVSTTMEINSQGDVIDYQFFNSIINSNYRLNYEEVEEMIENDNIELSQKYKDVSEELDKMYELSKLLLSKREQDGILDMDIPETEVKLDNNLHTINVTRRERLNSHRLIEAFMLLCNEVVATHLYNLDVPTIYRNHEKPDEMKIKELADFLNSMGIGVNPKHLKYSRKLQEILNESYNRPSHYIIQKKVLRSMKKAEYGAKNQGHFGLASPCYLHFTSPIRRYPDLVVHRILKKIMSEGHLSSERVYELNKTLPAVAKHCSIQERLAERIEREAVTIKALEFMKQFVGDVFEGIISGIESYGFFVELLEYPVDGLVKVGEIDDDYYVFYEDKHKFVGKRTRRSFNLGQKVRVQITKVDLDNLEMDLMFVKTKNKVDKQRKKQTGAQFK